MLKKTTFIISALLLLSLVNSCGKKTIIYDQPELIAETGFYQKAWVDPQIVYSDTLITIIRANRVDSFYVDTPEKDFNENIVTVAFEIYTPTCFTSVLLLDASGNLISVLAADELPVGHYKVSLTKSKITYMQPGAKRFFLKTDFCGFSVVEDINL